MYIQSILLNILLFRINFLQIRFLDVLDILLVALLIFLLYKLLKGTIAANIFLGLLSVYFLWLAVKAFEMSLLGTILGQFLGVGVILILIVFQQEIRKFLLMIGQRNVFFTSFKSKNLLPWNWSFNNAPSLNYNEILKACGQLAKSHTGAIIVLTKGSELRGFAQSGVHLDADISSKLLIAIFNKESPLHDGAVIIVKNKIRAASCILPVSENNKIPDNLGLRHRASLGIAEISDAISIAVSEENGKIAVALGGELKYDVNLKELRNVLEQNYINIADVE